MPNDSVLMTRLATGDEVAFNMLFERYRDKLYHYLNKITKSPEISEEIVIDIFVKIWVGRELMSQVEKPEAFLHKVAYHKALDFLKTTSRHARLQQLYIDRIEHTTENDIEDLIMDAQSKELLHKAVLSLPPQRKLIYTMSRKEGLTHDQIALALNLSKSTVKNSMVAAVKSITEYLQKHKSAQTLGLIFLS